MDIFGFDNYKDFLKVQYFPEGKYQHQKDNLATVSSQLGYKSPSSLAMILNGLRTPSSDMTDSITKNLKLSLKEEKYFKLLIKLEKQKKKGECQLRTKSDLQKLSGRSKPGERLLEISDLENVYKWYCTAVKQIAQSENGHIDAKEISLRLKRKITPSQAKAALSSLQKLKEYEEEACQNSDSLRTTSDVPSNFLKYHHLGMMDRARESLHEVSVENREFQSLCFRFEARRMQEAKKAIRNFVIDFNTEFGSEHSKEIFQMNVQFFPHTKVKGNEK